MATNLIKSAFLGTVVTCALVASAQNRPATRPARPPVPARDPHTAGYVEAKELPDATNPPADADGNFIIGPSYKRAPEMEKHADVPQGTPQVAQPVSPLQPRPQVARLVTGTEPARLVRGHTDDVGQVLPVVGEPPQDLQFHPAGNAAGRWRRT